MHRRLGDIRRKIGKHIRDLEDTREQEYIIIRD